MAHKEQRRVETAVVVDEVGYTPIDREECNLFFRFIANRYEKARRSLPRIKHSLIGRNCYTIRSLSRLYWNGHLQSQHLSYFCGHLNLHTIIFVSWSASLVMALGRFDLYWSHNLTHVARGRHLNFQTLCL